jgi:hypothetical protein
MPAMPAAARGERWYMSALCWKPRVGPLPPPPSSSAGFR